MTIYLDDRGITPAKCKLDRREDYISISFLSGKPVVDTWQLSLIEARKFLKKLKLVLYDRIGMLTDQGRDFRIVRRDNLIVVQVRITWRYFKIVYMDMDGVENLIDQLETYLDVD